MENLDFREVSTILEAGCGRGQLTIPFVKKIRRIKEKFRYIAYDISAGPYESDLEILKKEKRKENLGKLIVAVKGDVRNMKAIKDESIDLIVSNELFCELNSDGLEKAIEEFHRILKPNRQMAHGELSPAPENEAQKLVIEANVYFSLDTMQPKPEWFSPFSDEVVALMHKIGFQNIVVKYFETNVKMDYNTSIKKLNEWTIDPVFIKRHLNDIKRYGLEYPMEHVIFCKK